MEFKGESVARIHLHEEVTAVLAALWCCSGLSTTRCDLCFFVERTRRQDRSFLGGPYILLCGTCAPTITKNCTNKARTSPIPPYLHGGMKAEYASEGLCRCCYFSGRVESMVAYSGKTTFHDSPVCSRWSRWLSKQKLL